MTFSNDIDTLRLLQVQLNLLYRFHANLSILQGAMLRLITPSLHKESFILIRPYGSRCFRRILLCIGLIFWTGSVLSRAAGATPRMRILIVKARDNAFYNPVADGIASGLKSRGYRNGDRIELVTISLSGKGDDDVQQVHNQVGKHPQLIFAIGTDAATLLRQEKPEAPVVFSMVLDPVTLGLVKTLEAPGANFTGTTLLISPGKQLDALAQTVPQLHKIGVLYTDQDATSLAFLTDAQKDAQRLGLEIVALPAKHLGSPDMDLSQLGTVDAFWLIPDPASTGPQAVKATLEFALSRHLPVLGASSGTVRAGALLALSANLQDLGDQTADMASHILDGTETAAKMRVRGPRLTLLSVNLDVARTLKRNIPDTMLHLADEVIDTQKEGKQ